MLLVWLLSGGRECPGSALETHVDQGDADLDTLATALYVRVDDRLKSEPGRAPWRPAVVIAPKTTDAELITVAMIQAMLGFTIRGPVATAL